MILKTNSQKYSDKNWKKKKDFTRIIFTGTKCRCILPPVPDKKLCDYFVLTMSNKTKWQIFNTPITLGIMLLTWYSCTFKQCWTIILDNYKNENKIQWNKEWFRDLDRQVTEVLIIILYNIILWNICILAFILHSCRVGQLRVCMMSDIAQFADVLFVAYIMCCSSLDIQVIYIFWCIRIQYGTAIFKLLSD